MTGGSLQLQRYLSARRQGRTMLIVCVEAGIGADEARLIEADIARDPSLLAAPTPSPAPAPIPAQPKENDDMPRGKKAQQGTINGEVRKPDFELAGRIHRNDIQPANKEQKRAMKEASDGWKAVKKDAHVNVSGFRQAMKVADMEHAEQQEWLRSFNGGLKERNVSLSYDLVDQAEGKDRGAGADVVPIGEARAPQLATIPGDDSDLAGGADNDAHTGDEDLHAAE